VVYILVDPRVLLDFYLPWPVNWQITTWEYGTLSVEGYLAAYTESGAGTPPIRCASREFYEVPPTQLAELGGLEPFISSMEAERDLFIQTWLMPRIRIMSWREI
jgi:hypothetical protein